MSATSKRRFFIAAGAAAVLGTAAITGIGLSQAASTNPESSLVETLANKFHLNKAEVQQVFDDHHAQMRQQHEQRYSDMLDQAVAKGDLTNTQKDKLLAKHQELAAQLEGQRNSGQNLSPAERHTAMDQQRTELEQWAKDNDVPLKYLLPHGGGHGHPGFDMPGHGPSRPGGSSQAD